MKLKKEKLKTMSLNFAEKNIGLFAKKTKTAARAHSSDTSQSSSGSELRISTYGNTFNIPKIEIET
jgi:hypothetical protein